MGFGGRDKDIGRVQCGDTGNEGRMQFGDIEEENTDRVLSGGRGGANAGKMQDADKKAIWCCEGSQKGRGERI